MKIINLTPHTLNIFNKSGVETIVPRIEVSPGRFLCLRCEQSSKTVSELADGIEVVQTSFGKLIIGTVNEVGKDFIPDTSLSIPDNGDIYVVSMTCLQKIKSNECIFIDWIYSSKFLAPGEVVKDNFGNYIGCKGLSKL
jgi:hypothetical protein